MTRAVSAGTGHTTGYQFSSCAPRLVPIHHHGAFRCESDDEENMAGETRDA